MGEHWELGFAGTEFVDAAQRLRLKEGVRLAMARKGNIACGPPVTVEQIGLRRIDACEVHVWPGMTRAEIESALG